jgi:hypothetical protein
LLGRHRLLPDVDAAGFPTVEEVTARQAELDAIGLRDTAGIAHERYIDLLQERLERVGVREVVSESVPLRRWAARSWRLEVQERDRWVPVPTVSYIPYSGQTPASGVSGPLVAADGATAEVRGAIALYEINPRVTPNRSFGRLAYSVFDPDGVLDRTQSTLLWRPNQSRSVLADLEAGGAAAAIGVVGLPDELARTYFPYDGLRRRIPGVYVDRPTGEQLRLALAQGRRARVTLIADVTATSSRNLWATIPGATRQLVILNCHTDGTNGIEDNGADAIVAIAGVLAALAPGHLPRSVLVSLTTGHFHGGIGQRAFVASHARDLLPRAAAALCVEHLGARYIHAASGEETPDGETAGNQLGLFFAPEIQTLVRLAHATLVAADARPALVAHPITPLARAPNRRGFPTEGHRLWASGIPTASFITNPLCLFSWGTSTMPYFNGDLMRRQMIAFTRMTMALSATPARELVYRGRRS